MKWEQNKGVLSAEEGRIIFKIGCSAVASDGSLHIIRNIASDEVFLSVSRGTEVLYLELLANEQEAKKKAETLRKTNEFQRSGGKSSQKRG